MMSVFIKFLLLSTSIILMSCKNDVKDVNANSSSSTFELGKVSKNSFFTSSSDPKWPDLKDQATVDLQVCIVDRLYVEKVIGEDFQISSDLGSSEKSTDVNGCLNWQEKFQFDSTADETYFKISGDIEGLDNYKGYREFNIAVNPWTNSVIDLNKGGTAPKLVGILDEVKTKTILNQLEVTDYTINIKKLNFEDNAAKLELEVKVSPSIIRKKIDGSKSSPVKLTSGEFEIEYLLVQRDKGTNKRVIITEVEETGVVDDEGKIVSYVKLDIEGEDEIKLDSQLELVMITRALDAPLSIGLHEGYIQIDSLQKNIVGKKLLDLPVGVNQLKLISQNNEKSLVKNQDHSHGFLISTVIGEPVVNHGKGNLVFNSTERTKRTTVDIKIVDSLVYNGVNSSFDVKMLDTVTGEVVFDDIVSTIKEKDSGILRIKPNFDFDETFEFSYRDYVIKVKGTKAPFDGIEQERLVWVNPRIAGAGFLLDPKYEDSKPDVEDAKKPEIFIRDFNFEFISNNDAESFRLNKNLALVSDRVIRVSFSPELKGVNNPDGEGLPKLMTGSYKASLLILSPHEPYIQAYDRNVNLEDFYLITGDEVDVVSEGGIMNIDFKLPHLFEEKMYLAFKNLAVLKLEPKNTESAVKPGHIIGTIELLKSSDKVISIYDSQEKTPAELMLDRGNQVSISKKQKALPIIKKKLEEDHLIGNTFQTFKKDILENRMVEKVPVVDHVNYKVKNMPIDFNVYDTEEELIHNQGDKLEISRDEITNMIVDMRVSLPNLKKLCKLFYDPNQVTVVKYEGSFSGKTIGREKTSILPKTIKHIGLEYDRCRKDPFAHIDLKELKFMEKILQQPKELRESTGDATVTEEYSEPQKSEAYFTSKGEMFSKIEGARHSNFIGAGSHGGFEIDVLSKKVLGAPASILSTIDVGTRTDYYSMEQDAEIVSNQKRIIDQEGVSYMLSKVKVSFEARLKKCLQIAPKYVKYEVPTRYVSALPTYDSVVNKFSKNDTRALVTSPKRYIVCMEFSRDEILDEMWYFLRLAKSEQEGVSDMALARNSEASAIIRGEAAYKEYRLSELSESKKLVIHPEAIDATVERYKKFMKNKGKQLKYKDSVGSGYPGLIEVNYQ